MRRNLILLPVLLIPFLLFAQADEDIYEANRLKKVFPDDRVAATIVEEEYNFDKGRSEDKLPVVTATKNTGMPASSILISTTLFARSLPSNSWKR